mmetsp:Transcript_19190/g.26556  ORF Transcript_19190/g.26556 Transcript_19190/m.26556 type:complete len:198 (-) Transcript_19190:230-823(-)
MCTSSTIRGFFWISLTWSSWILIICSALPGNVQLGKRVAVCLLFPVEDSVSPLPTLAASLKRHLLRPLQEKDFQVHIFISSSELHGNGTIDSLVSSLASSLENTIQTVHFRTHRITNVPSISHRCDRAAHDTRILTQAQQALLFASMYLSNECWADIQVSAGALTAECHIFPLLVELNLSADLEETPRQRMYLQLPI